MNTIFFLHFCLEIASLEMFYLSSCFFFCFLSSNSVFGTTLYLGHFENIGVDTIKWLEFCENEVSLNCLRCTVSTSLVLIFLFSFFSLLLNSSLYFFRGLILISTIIQYACSAIFLCYANVFFFLSVFLFSI